MKHKYFVSVNTFLLLFILQITSYSQPNSDQLKYLTKNSDAIITGKVISQKSHWNENRTRIYTTAILQVEDFIKGSSVNNRIEVIYAGGEVDGVGELYTHIARLENQEDVLLFIKKEKITGEKFTIMNGEQGKFTLHTDKRTGEKLAGDNLKLSVYKSAIKKIIAQD